MDRIDDQTQRLVDQWGAERPDLDRDAMATVARLLQLGRLLGDVVEGLAAGYGIQPPEGDVLFALRRAGAPYRLSPARLSESLLVSSGTLTSRLDRLEAKGLIDRSPHATDRRSVEVRLTNRARMLVDEAVTLHVRNEQRILAELTESELNALNRTSSALIDRLVSGDWREAD